MSVYRSAAAVVPAVPAGTVLELGPEEWAYSYGRSLRLRVQRVREDLAYCYPDRVWVEGWVLGPGHEARGWKTALVPVSVLRREADAARGCAR